VVGSIPSDRTIDLVNRALGIAMKNSVTTHRDIDERALAPSAVGDCKDHAPHTPTRGCRVLARMGDVPDATIYVRHQRRGVKRAAIPHVLGPAMGAHQRQIVTGWVN
jgi:hypothetical protein